MDSVYPFSKQVAQSQSFDCDLQRHCWCGERCHEAFHNVHVLAVVQLPQPFKVPQTRLPLSPCYVT